MLQIRNLLRLVGSYAQYSVQSYRGVMKNLPIRENEYYRRKPTPKKFNEQLYNVVLPTSLRRYKIRDKTTPNYPIFFNGFQRNFKENNYAQKKRSEDQRRSLGKIRKIQTQWYNKPSLIIVTKYNPNTPNLWRSVKEMYHWKRDHPELAVAQSQR